MLFVSSIEKKQDGYVPCYLSAKNSNFPKIWYG